jgi:hypothetical protein
MVRMPTDSRLYYFTQLPCYCRSADGFRVTSNYRSIHRTNNVAVASSLYSLALPSESDLPAALFSISASSLSATARRAREIDFLAATKLNGHSLDEIPLTLIDRNAHPRRSDDVAVVSLAERSELLVIPRSAVADGLSHFQGLTLKIRSVKLTHLGLQIPQPLFANFEVKLDQRIDMVFVWFEARNPFQVDPDALEFDRSGRHFSVRGS